MQRRARGLNCDVFIRTREDFPLGPLKVHAVLEFYFLAVSQNKDITSIFETNEVF